MLKTSLIGSLPLAITVVIHALGTAYWIKHLLHRYAALEGPWPSRTIAHALVSTVVVLLCLHIVEVVIWAVLFLQVLPADATWNLEKAVYFSFVTFTTLGYGDITLGPEWLLLSGIEALNGILLVGWSTAFLFAVLQRIWQAGAVVLR